MRHRFCLQAIEFDQIRHGRLTRNFDFACITEQVEAYIPMKQVYTRVPPLQATSSLLPNRQTFPRQTKNLHLKTSCTCVSTIESKLIQKHNTSYPRKIAENNITHHILNNSLT